MAQFLESILRPPMGSPNWRRTLPATLAFTRPQVLGYDVRVLMTKRLNEQLRRNSNWFPNDFAFQLTEEEWGALRSQTATLKTVRGRKRKYLPFAFTEHGALMAADILNSLRAVVMSVYVTPLTVFK